MIALASVWDAVIIIALVLAVLLIALAILAKRGRRVHIQLDVDREPDEEPPVSTDQ